MNNLDKLRMKQLSHNIGLKLLKLAKHKQKICIFANIQEGAQYKDLFSHLCYMYQFFEIGHNVIDFYDDRKTNIETIYQKYNLIIYLKGHRFHTKYDIKLFAKNVKEVEIGFFSLEDFSSKVDFNLAVSFEDDIYDYVKVSPHKWDKVIKKEYEKLIN